MKIENLKFDAIRNQFNGQITATLISVSDTLLQNKVTGKEYTVATIQFEGKQRSAIVYKANLDKGLTVGTDYLCNVTFTAERPEEPIIAVSPLTNAVRATAQDFGFDFTKAMAEAGVGAEQTV